MYEQLTSFEVSKLAKEKGFNLEVLEFYNEEGVLEDYDNFMNYGCEGGVSLQEWYINHNTFKGRYSAPNQSLLQRWLREVHDINVLISFETIDDSTTAYIWNIIEYIEEGKNRKKDTWDFYNRTNSFNEMMWYDTYEEALEEGLYQALKLIKN